MKHKTLFFRAELQKAGKGLILILPDNLAKLAGLKAGDFADVSFERSRVIQLPKRMADAYRKHLPCLSGLSNGEISLVLDLHNREKVSGKSMAGMYGPEIKRAYGRFVSGLKKADKTALMADIEKAAGKC